MKNKALFTGTFDPPTLGHLDIIHRSANIFQTLYVGIAENLNKPNPLFSLRERIELLQKITGKIPNIEICQISGLVVDFVEKNNVGVIVRGLRAFSNHENEFQMALANRRMCGVETLFLISDEKHSHISSSLIKEIAPTGHHLRDFVPKEVESAIFKKLKTKI